MDCKYPKALITIGDHIRKRRLDLGLLQREAAAWIGADTMTVVNWEKNHTTPHLNHMPGIVRFLGYSPFVKCDDMSQRLINYRRRLGLTQEYFARMLGIDPSTLARWERGERKPHGMYLQRVEKTIDSPAQ